MTGTARMDEITFKSIRSELELLRNRYARERIIFQVEKRHLKKTLKNNAERNISERNNDYRKTMLKTSVLKILSAFAVSFVTVFSTLFVSASAGGMTEFGSEAFKNSWNDAFVRADKAKLSAIISELGDSVKKLSVASCESEGFYDKEGNTYFCNGGTVFVFSGKSFSESAKKTAESLWILMALSLIFSLAFTTAFYARGKDEFKTIASSKHTVSELDRKLTESCALYEKYVTDIEDFDNSPEANTEALFRVAYGYFFVSKRHSNNILNKLSKVKKKILDTGLEKNFAVFFEKYDEFYEAVNRETSPVWKRAFRSATDPFAGNPTLLRFSITLFLFAIVVALAENGLSPLIPTGTDSVFRYTPFIDSFRSIIGFSETSTVRGFVTAKLAMLTIAFDFVSLVLKNNLKLK